MPLAPLLKWAGGKEKELSVILPNLPKEFTNYYEPFVGGGSVFTAINAQHYFINDRSTELMGLYNCIQSNNNQYFFWINNITAAWMNMLNYAQTHPELVELYNHIHLGELPVNLIPNLINDHINENQNNLNRILPEHFQWERETLLNEVRKNLSRKLARMFKLETEKGDLPNNDIYRNIETALMSALYMYFRGLYNNEHLMHDNFELSISMFSFIRDYAYSGMFRYNDNGDFNVPYGGMGYNHKMLNRKNNYYQSEELLHLMQETELSNLDFEDFFNINQPTENDFIFLDPPYDSEFSTYAKNKFGREDQRRLANYLINNCHGKWMMIIKNTPFIFDLYDNQGLNIRSFGKKYLVSFMNRNDKDVEHLLITNY